MLDLVEADRHLLGLVLPRVESVLKIMVAEGITHPADTFRLLLRFDPTAPPPIPASRYLTHVLALRAIFRFRGNETALELALGRAADLVSGLL